jgi:cystathionine beta-lyase/cystathionine gamma-synthase
VLRTYGLEFSYVDTTDLEKIKTALLPNTRLVWLETPSNPHLMICDIAAIVEIAKQQRSSPYVVVDNTFATPFLQRPLELGANLVVHSTTKYLGGHSDVIGGAVVGSDPNLHERLAFIQNAVGVQADGLFPDTARDQDFGRAPCAAFGERHSDRQISGKSP